MPMKTAVLILLMMSFASCRSGREIRYTGEQCSPVFVYTDSLPKQIDLEKSYCNVRMYEFNYYRIGPVNGTETKKPISFCDRCTGFKAYPEFVTFSEKVRREINEADEVME